MDCTPTDSPTPPLRRPQFMRLFLFESMRIPGKRRVEVAASLDAQREPTCENNTPLRNLCVRMLHQTGSEAPGFGSSSGIFPKSKLPPP